MTRKTKAQTNQTGYFVRKRITDRTKLQDVSKAMKAAGFKLEEEVGENQRIELLNPSTHTVDGRHLSFWSFKTTIWGRAIALFGLVFGNSENCSERKRRCQWVFEERGPALVGGKTGIYNVLHQSGQAEEIERR